MTITFRPACSISTFISTMKVILVIVMIKESSSGNSLLFHKYSTKVVRTKYGPLRGVMIHIHPPVEAFLGVPYATPPVGSLRYMPPVTPSIWRNIRLADRFGAVCPQSLPDISNRSEALLEYPKSRLFHLEKLLPLLTNQSEDCLYLNLYVPRTGQACRDSWTKLRNAYTNACKNFKVEIRRSDHMEPRTSQSNFQPQNENNAEIQDDESDKNATDDVVTEDRDYGEEHRASTPLRSLPEVSASSNTNDKPNVSSFSRKPTGKKKIEKSMTELVTIMKSNNRMRSQMMRPSEPPRETGDDIDLFFQSLPKTVKKLPKDEQVRLKMSIGNLVFEAELRNISPRSQPQVITVAVPDPSPALSSSASYSNETFIQTESEQHYFPHNEENSHQSAIFTFTEL